jgi:Zn-dependent protease with chaperone function
MIIRTPSKATGGITLEEKIKMDALAKQWSDIAMRTRPIDPSKIIPAIEGIYAAAKLKKPRVVIVPSPLVMAFAYGASAWIWHCRGKKEPKQANATRAATNDATYVVTNAEIGRANV